METVSDRCTARWVRAVGRAGCRGLATVGSVMRNSSMAALEEKGGVLGFIGVLEEGEESRARRGQPLGA